MQLQAVSLNYEQNFNGVKANGLNSKQKVIYKKLENLFDVITYYKGLDLSVESSPNSYVHSKSGRYEFCTQMKVIKDNNVIGINKNIPNTTKAWMKAFRELVKTSQNSVGWKYFMRKYKAGEPINY